VTPTKAAQAFTAEERQQYIGCSEFGAVCGLDKYKTPLDVYNLKLGLVEPFQGNNHTERGNRLEAIAAQMFTELTGRQLRRKNSAFVHPDYPFIVGHIDRTIVGEQRIAEIKCPSVAAYRKMQRDGLPESMVLQMQGYLGLSGYTSGEWIVFCADQMDIAHFTVDFDEAIYNAAIKATVELWTKHILPGIPPPAEKADKEKIEIAKTGGTVTHRDDPKFTNAVQLLKESKDITADAKELSEMAKRAVADAVEGEFGIYEGGGARVYYVLREGRMKFNKTAAMADHPQIDWSKYEEQGDPYAEFRAYFTNTGE